MGGAPQIKTMSINEKIIRTKIGLLNLAEELGNVSKACQMMGLSRDTFYRYKNAMEQGGVDALLDKNRRVPNRKNRVDERIEERVCALAVENPALGQVRVSNELRKEGALVHIPQWRCAFGMAAPSTANLQVAAKGSGSEGC